MYINLISGIKCVLVKNWKSSTSNNKSYQIIAVLVILTNKKQM